MNWRPTKKANVIILNPIKKKLATMPYYFILIGLEASLDDHTMQKMILHLAHIVVKTSKLNRNLEILNLLSLKQDTDDPSEKL